MAYDTERLEHAPVRDWVNDWDWLDDQWGPDAIDIWDSAREQCPVATTERYGRAFMPVTMDAVRHPAPPITSDPPDHHSHRRLPAACVRPEACRHDGRRPVGSSLARAELLVAHQEWVRAFPNYTLDTSQATTWANGQIRAPRNVPVLLNR